MVDPQRLIGRLTGLYLLLLLFGVLLPQYDAYSVDQYLRLARELSNSRTRGYFGPARIQAQVVSFVILACGRDLLRYVYGVNDRRYDLSVVIEMARERYNFLVSARQIRRWVCFFMNHGEIPEVYRARVRTRRRYRVNQTRLCVRKWKGVDSCNLREILDTHPYFYLEQITLQMELMSGRRWSRATVSREIRRLGVSLQVVYERARQIDGSQRAAYKIALHHHVSYVDQLVFIDETSKGENASVRRRFWNPIGGTQPFFEEFFGSHNKRYTMLAAGDVNGFIVESVDVVHRERGPRDTCPLRGTIGMERFEMWVEEKLCPVLGNWANAEPRSIVVIDNATIHHSERVRGMIMATGAKIIYTAPYSPDLNPIEYYFGVYKSYLKKFIP